MTSLTYNIGRFSATLQARWIDGGLLDRTFLDSATAIPASQRPANSVLALCNNGTVICTIDDNHLPSKTYFDTRFAARLGQGGRMEVFVNLNNLLDEDPVIAPGAVGRTGVGLGINTSLYDILGRRYNIGMKYSF